MNEVLYAVEYFISSLTWGHAAVLAIAVVGVLVVFRLLKAKQDKIEEKLDEE